MEIDRPIPEGAEVRVRIGTEIEVATVVRPGASSIRVRLRNGIVVKRKIDRDIVEVLDVGEERILEDADGTVASGNGSGEEAPSVPEVPEAVQE